MVWRGVGSSQLKGGVVTRHRSENSPGHFQLPGPSEASDPSRAAWAGGRDVPSLRPFGKPDRMGGGRKVGMPG